MKQLLTAAAIAATLVLAGCGSTGKDNASDDLDPSDWDSVLAAADGSEVNWYMYGGDDVLNAFVADEVEPRLQDLGISLNQVRIDDTAEAVNKALGDKQAGRSDGAVDAVWVNGENFATGVQADLWSCGWAEQLPNAEEYVDLADPAVQTDFGTPVDGCEAVWQQAHSALVYDSAALDDADVESVESLRSWVEANPGQFTYPAAPDFTGAMAVRTLLYGQLGGADELSGAFDEDAYAAATEDFYTSLNDLESSLWRGGDTYPTAQTDVEELYANGEISAFFTYGPGAVGDKVDDGLYPRTTRTTVPSPGNISNYSFIAVPDNAANKAAGYVLANLLQEPEVQLALYEATGIFPGVALQKLPDDVRTQFEEVQQGPSVITLEELTADAQPELASEYITRIEKDWKARVLQK